MAINLNIEKFGAQFNAFVNFANANSGRPDTLARIDGVGPYELLDPNGNPRTIVAKTDGDKIKHFTQNLFFSRKDGQKALNTAVRDLFKETVLKVCGVETFDELPPAVRDVIKKDDFGNAGHPLSVRRILAVKDAINIATEEEKIIAKITQKCVGNAGALRSAMDAVLREARNDPDLMHLLTGNDCAVAQGVILTSATREVRPLAEILRRFKAVKENLEELRAATGANRRLFERLVSHLGQMGGKAFPKGIIAKMFAAAQKTDVSSLRNISAESPIEEIAKALCVFEMGVAKVGKEVKPMETFRDEFGNLGADVLLIFNNLVVAIIGDKCDEDTLRGIKAAMSTENAGKVVRACEHLFGDEILPRGVAPDKAVLHAVKVTAYHLCEAGTTRLGVIAAVNEILGTENEDNCPNVKKIGKNDFLTVYTVFEGLAKEELV